MEGNVYDPSSYDASHVGEILTNSLHQWFSAHLLRIVSEADKRCTDAYWELKKAFPRTVRLYEQWASHGSTCPIVTKSKGTVRCPEPLALMCESCQTYLCHKHHEQHLKEEPVATDTVRTS